jgi:hypothetical protein
LKSGDVGGMALLALGCSASYRPGNKKDFAWHHGL